MKHLSAYKSLGMLLPFLLLCGVCFGQKTDWNEKSAAEMFDNYGWAGGVKLKAHRPLNLIAFAKEYELNKAAWDKATGFLRDRNLELMAPGKYPIDGDKIYAIISEGEGKDLDSSAWEGHRKYADLHYVIKGREKIGINDKDILKVTKPYDEATDNENYYTNGKFYIANPDNFFIFLPGDIHLANLRGSKKVKKLVIKIKTIPVTP